MQSPRIIRNRLLSAAASILLFLPAAVPAHAVSKEMVQLQTQVQQLLDMVQRLQSTLDSRFGVIQDLAQQTAEQAKQMTATVNALQQKLNTENEALSGKQDTLSGQVQSLNDSVDELKARIAKLDKSVQDLQAQLQAMQAQQTQAMQGGAQPGGTQPGAMPPGGQPNTGGPDQGPGMPNVPQGGSAPGPSPALQAPPLQETYQAAERDFDAGKFKVAQGEFQDDCALLSAGRPGRHGAVLPGRDRLPAEGLRGSDQLLQRGAGRIQRQCQGARGGVAQGLLPCSRRTSGKRESTSCAS